MSTRLGIDGESGIRRKAISPERDRGQSKALTAVVCLGLGFAASHSLIQGLREGYLLQHFAAPFVISALFGAAVWALRAATPGGIAVGILISFVLLTPAPEHRPTGTFARVFPLVAVFALSFIATRFRRTQKESEGLAEARRGRQASQIVANLGAAALFSACGSHLASIAALAEAAADTASSEVGQALGGSVRLLTTWKPVPAGTDGGITLKGTLAGFTSGGIVILVASASHPIWRQAIAAWLAACTGLFFDSLLGATVERKGWFGNDLVNFSSTIFAGLVAAIFS